MNMEFYQKFFQIKEFVKMSVSSPKYEKMIRDNIETIKKRPSYQDLSSDDMVVQVYWKNARVNVREVDLFLDESTVYEIDEKNKHLLMLTKNPRLDDKSLWNMVRLPFRSIFIDVEFTSEEHGGDGDVVTGILLREMKSVRPSINKEKKEILGFNTYGLWCYICGIDKNGTPFCDKLIFPIDSEDDFRIEYQDKPLSKFIRSFVVNFILFLKDREVTYIERKRSYSKRREKEGKIQLPSSRVITLTGEIKRYVNSLSDGIFRGSLSYKFWVSGHWRTYRDDRYKEVKGHVKWIEPFQKGKGVEVKHTYRINQTDDKNLYFEDI